MCVKICNISMVVMIHIMLFLCSSDAFILQHSIKVLLWFCFNTMHSFICVWNKWILFCIKKLYRDLSLSSWRDYTYFIPLMCLWIFFLLLLIWKSIVDDDDDGSKLFLLLLILPFPFNDDVGSTTVMVVVLVVVLTSFGSLMGVNDSSPLESFSISAPNWWRAVIVDGVGSGMLSL